MAIRAGQGGLGRTLPPTFARSSRPPRGRPTLTSLDWREPRAPAPRAAAASGAAHSLRRTVGAEHPWMTSTGRGPDAARVAVRRAPTRARADVPARRQRSRRRYQDCRGHLGASCTGRSERRARTREVARASALDALLADDVRAAMDVCLRRPEAREDPIPSGPGGGLGDDVRNRWSATRCRSRCARITVREGRDRLPGGRADGTSTC